MKTILKIFICAIIGCAITASCTSDDTEARNFVARITTALYDGNPDSIKVLYPEAKDAISKAGSYKFLVDLLEAEDAKYKDLGDGVWRVSIGDSVKVHILEGEEEGQFTIKESFGLIDYGTDRLKFAYATGWIDKKMNDVQIAEQLSDNAFIEWLGVDFLAQIKNNITVKKTGTFGDIKDGGTWVCSDGINVTVTNRNDFDIPSECYNIQCSDWSRSHPRDTTVVDAMGDDLRAHGKMVQSVDILTTMESTSEQQLIYDDECLLKLIYKNYKATGNEYKRYKSK